MNIVVQSNSATSSIVFSHRDSGSVGSRREGGMGGGEGTGDPFMAVMVNFLCTHTNLRMYKFI